MVLAVATGGTALRNLAAFRNLALNTFRLAGRVNIAHAHRDLHDRADTFAVYGIQQTMIKPGVQEQRRGRDSVGGSHRRILIGSHKVPDCIHRPATSYDIDR